MMGNCKSFECKKAHAEKDAEIKRLREQLRISDTHAEKIEALLDPHILWGDAPLPSPPSTIDRRTE